jgi:hypothetical protein
MPIKIPKMGIDMDAKFDMDSVEKERYENIST